MAWASRSGRARTSSSNPEAFAVCQRCGIWYNRRELKNQYEWRGAALLPTWLFVCPRCYDTPFENDRVIVLPADPVPIPLPFPEDFEAATSTVMSLKLDAPPLTLMGLIDRATPMMTVSGVYMAEEQEVAAPLPVDPKTGLTIPNPTAMQTVDGVMMGPTPSGRPPGYALEAVMPLAMTDGVPTEFDVPVPVMSLVANGSPLVTATCPGPHGLKLNAQIAVRGTLNPLADGMFSVTPITATVFTYGTYSPIAAGAILGPETVIVTAQVGIPREFEELPQTGLSQTRPSPGVQ